MALPAVSRLLERVSLPTSTEGSPTTSRDLILVLRCLQGDEEAWGELVNTYSRPVFNHSYRFTGRRDVAEDLTQEIFLRAYRNLESFRAESASFRTWLYRVSRNLLIDHLRKERRSSITFFDHNEEKLAILDDRSPGPLRLMERAEAARILSAGLMALAPDLRQAITLRELDGLSYREIARIAGTVEGTIKSRVSRGRLQLARLLMQRRLTGFTGRRNTFGLTRFQIPQVSTRIQGALA
jgi:RNA polymerase sigma-70 factor (ECF subfamily)